MLVSKSSFAMGWICLVVSCSVSIAQQNLPRPIVLYRPPAVGTPSPRGPLTIARPVSQASPTPNPTASPVQYAGQPFPVVPRQTQIPPAFSSSAASVTGAAVPMTEDRSPSRESNESRDENKVETQQQADEREAAAQQTRPTNQMLQNPSGAYNFSHVGMTTGQQMAPNLYFGAQFQNWSNQQGMSQMPGAFGEMSRFQPGSSGAQMAPNTYLGSGFSSWSNLSSGAITPNAQGGWSYSVWP